MKKRTRFITGILAALALTLPLCACSEESYKDDIPPSPGPEISVTTAYNQAKELGFSGTLDEFIALISGKDGVDGTDGKDGKDGANGTNGKDGKDGVNGTNGKDGRGIVSVTVNADGNLIVTFTDGNSVTAGSVIIQCAHNYGAWQAGTAATCTSIGYDTRVCGKCGNVDYRFNEQLGHDYDDAVTVIDATCTKKGLDVLTCSRCGDTKSELTDELGHEPSSSYTCVRCGKDMTDYLEATFEFNLINDGTAYEVGAKHKQSISGTVYIPSEYNGLPVTRIKRVGFSMARNITKVVIPESITEIYAIAFGNCQSLKSVIIPKTVISIQQRVFTSTEIDIIQIDSENPVYIGNENYIVEKPTKTLIYGKSTDYIPVDGSVEHIGAYAFERRKYLGNIVIPEGVKTIDNRAFISCSKCTSLSLPSTVTNIDDYAFYYTIITESITVAPDNAAYKSVNNCLIDIANKTLIKGCNNNSTIPDDGSVEIIGRQAFYNCTAVTHITIPEGVMTIDDFAFDGCKITEISIPNSVTAIGSWAFSSTSLTNITLPDTIQLIGDNAFNNTPYYRKKDNWENGALYIGKFLVETVSTLPEEYTVRDGTLAIACNAFEGRNLTKITISDSVLYIGHSAFERCTNLTDITIGANVRVIGKLAFYYCKSIERVTFSDPATWYRHTSVSGDEPLPQEDLSDPEKAAECIKDTVLRVDNLGYGYLWYKQSAFTD